MNDQEWFDYYDEHKEAFHWFIDEYFFDDVWIALERFRDKRGRFTMITILNFVWFELPDHKFNIIENPPGWNELLHLIEE